MKTLFTLAALLLAAPVAWSQDQDDLKAAEAAYAEAWNAAPMTVENAMFVSEKASSYGGYKRRPDGPFAADEPFYIYAEPKGYGFFDLGGENEFGVILDFEVETAGGVVILQQNAFQTISLKSRNEAREMFLNLTITLKGLAPGNFKLRIRMHDLGSEEVVEFEMPFEISAS
ncbi:hypothetical protein [Halovulum sp. GXIMD14793]